MAVRDASLKVRVRKINLEVISIWLTFTIHRRVEIVKAEGR